MTATNLTGTAAGLIAGTASAVAAAGVAAGALANGMTATTQAANDNSTKIATTAYVNAAVPGTSTTYAPTDQSGATLTFTGVSVAYTKIGNIVYVYGTLTFPSNSDASSIAISLPVAVPNQAYAAGTFSMTNSGGSNPTFARPIPNTSTFTLTNLAGSRYNNLTFSGVTITFAFFYPAS